MSAKSLEISPNGSLTFTEVNHRQKITIRNVSEKPVTYKLQSTVYGKFNIRPRWGTLSPNEHSQVLITMSKNAELSKKGRDKIVVVCMPAPINAVDFDMTSSFWRHNICYDPNIERHQLTCQRMDEGGEGGDGDKDPGLRGLFPSFCSIRTPSKYWR